MENIEIAGLDDGERLLAERDDDAYLVRFTRTDGDVVAELPFSIVAGADEEGPLVIADGLAIGPTDVARVKAWARLNTEPSFDDVDAAGLDVHYGPYTWADLELEKRIQ